MEEIMEEIGGSQLGGSQFTPQPAGESDTYIAVALLICFTLILFVAFRYAAFCIFSLYKLICIVPV